MTSKTRDDVWQAIRNEAKNDAYREPVLASFLHATILNHKSLENALSFHLASKMGCGILQPLMLMELFQECMKSDAKVRAAIRADLLAVNDRDPACPGLSVPLLYFKGFQALVAYRMTHWLWGQQREPLARLLQSRVSEVFQVDAHPAARIGKGVFMDHATGVVIGETAVIGDNVSMLHGVTLGGTGKQSGDRHPKVGKDVLIGAGVKILGNIKVGDGARIGAGSVVLNDVPAHCTVVGVPAKIVGHAGSSHPGLDMDQTLDFDEGAGI